MKALTYTSYGPPEEVLQLTDMVIPAPGENEVLVKVRAAAINDYDWSMVTGKPEAYRILFGLTKPKHSVPGMELAGTIEAIGPNATKFEVGDAVYGDISEFGFGAFAEYVTVNENGLVLKPDEISFEEAASVSHASMLAYQALVEIGRIGRNYKVLINGAGGGVGTFGVQLAKLYDAEVSGVDTGDKLSMMQSMGFDVVIDYKTTDFTQQDVQYDLILDCKTGHSPSAYLRCLKKGGKYVTVGGTIAKLLELQLKRSWINRFSGKEVHMVALKANKDLHFINELIKAGKLQYTIDGPYSLSEVPRLIQYFGDGLHEGKVIISLP